MAICGAELEKEEEGGRHTRGSGSGKAVEGLVNIGKQADEPGLSAEETLADLLKKLSDSYQPKKKRTPKATTSGTARANKKRKAAPSEASDIPLPRGKTTRSKLKQSEEELQRALEESKKKIVDKGKEKVVEPAEDVELDEMDLVHQSEKVAEVEVQTPKPKKAKTSSKKSSSVSKSAEPSILVKRTKSAVKVKQVKITEEDDWSGEEEDVSDGEKDKLTKFGKRTILKGRLLKDLEEEGMILLLEKLEVQGWKDMVLQLDGRLDRNKIVKFMANVEVKEGTVTSLVKGVQISFDAKELGEILGIPYEGYDYYTR
ncbi:protein pxr1-like [Nicotiana tomentosiformis]|uniref:protein pxr1-like n=1 Tax=Nicotiana tomentosiformis TaxID=4098 RepID=UPI00388CC1F4